MAEDKEVYIAWEGLLKTDFKIHHIYGQSYIEASEYTKQLNNISILRKNRAITLDERIIITEILNSASRHRRELKEYLYNQPRRDAQAFIGKKSVREEVFKLHGKQCLCCGSLDNISLDHIIPIYHKGENKIDNLQPLCRSCNSSKGTNIIDYRQKGGNYV